MATGTVKWFNATHTVDDELVMIFSTDHGMTEVKSLVPSRMGMRYSNFV